MSFWESLVTITAGRVYIFIAGNYTSFKYLTGRPQSYTHTHTHTHRTRNTHRQLDTLLFPVFYVINPIINIIKIIKIIKIIEIVTTTEELPLCPILFI